MDKITSSSWRLDGPTLGKTPVDARRAGEPLSAAEKIIAKIRDWLPESVQWTIYDYSFMFEFTKILGPPEVEAEEQPSAKVVPETL